MKNFLLVFLGGGLGSATRYGISRMLALLYTGAFPWATLATNIMACLLLGWVVGFAGNKQLFSQGTLLFWTVGFCGGFSTFSAFSRETIALVQEESMIISVVYAMASIVLCVASMLLGIGLAKQ